MTLEKPKSVADVLDAAADLIEPEGKWGTGYYAQNLRGSIAFAEGRWPRGKVCYCMLGAIAKARGDKAAPSYGSLQEFAAPLGFPDDISEAADWNDSHTQAEVVGKLRKAASLARQNGEKANG